MLSRCAFGSVIALMIISQANSAENPLALVIGNSDYVSAPKVPRASKDASAMGDMLRRIGFEVIVQQDVRKSAFDNALRDLSTKADQRNLVLVYFSGHGIELSDDTYLVPTDAEIARDLDVTNATTPLKALVNATSAARGLRLFFIDASRTNPFDGRRIVASRASPFMVDGSGDFTISYATRAGAVAEDGEGEHSIYTTALLKHLTKPGLEIMRALRLVRDDVMQATNKRQEPYFYGSVGRDYYLVREAKE